MPDKMSIAQFGQTVKAKHPEYGDMSDVEVGQKVLAKYPQYGDMVQSTGVPQVILDHLRAASSQPTQFEADGGDPNRPYPDTGIFAAIRRAASSIGGAPYDIGKAVASPPQSTAEKVTSMALPGNALLAAKRLVVDPMNAEAAKSRQLQAEGKPYVGHAIASGIPVIGPMAASIGERVGGGDPGALAELPMYAIAGKAADAADFSLPKKPPLSKEAAVENVTNAINPPVKEKPGVRANLSEQLDTIVQNRNIKTKGDLMAAIKDAAANDLYRKTFIEPNASVEVTTPTSYRGSTTLPYRATISQLDARLSTINDTLNPRFVKGGQGSVAAQAAIGSEQAASLMSEANAIRQTIAQELGTRMGIDPQVVYDARANYGQLRSLAEKVQTSIDTNGRLVNGDVPLSKRGVVERAIDQFYYKPRADRLIRNTVDNYQPGPSNIDTLREALANRINVSGPTASERYFARQMMQKLKR